MAYLPDSEWESLRQRIPAEHRWSARAEIIRKRVRRDATRRSKSCAPLPVASFEWDGLRPLHHLTFRRVDIIIRRRQLDEKHPFANWLYCDGDLYRRTLTNVRKPYQDPVLCFHSSAACRDWHPEHKCQHAVFYWAFSTPKQIARAEKESRKYGFDRDWRSRYQRFSARVTPVGQCGRCGSWRPSLALEAISTPHPNRVPLKQFGPGMAAMRCALWSFYDVELCANCRLAGGAFVARVMDIKSADEARLSVTRELQQQRSAIA